MLLRSQHEKINFLIIKLLVNQINIDWDILSHNHSILKKLVWSVQMDLVLDWLGQILWLLFFLLVFFLY